MALSFFSVCFAGSIQDAHKAVIARKNACGTQTFVGNPGDTETFEFEADDFCTTEFSWTDIDGVIDTYNTTQVKNGSHSAQLNFSGINQNDNYISVDLGVAGDSAFTLDFWIWVSDVNDYEGVNIFCASDSTAGACSTAVNLFWLHTGTGTWQLRIYGDATSDTSSNLSTETWYRIEFEYLQNDTTTAEIYNAAEELQDTITCTAFDDTPRYPWWGHAASDADATVFYIDDVRYKSSGGGF